MRKCLFYLFSFFALLAIISCNSSGKMNNSNESNSEDDFEVVGYLFWSLGKGSMSNIAYQYLTTINYAFAIPEPDNPGNLMPLSHPDTLRSLVRNAHEHNVKVFVSVGGFSIGDGPGIDTSFEVLANSAYVMKN